jgi:hypothetical protein
VAFDRIGLHILDTPPGEETIAVSVLNDRETQIRPVQRSIASSGAGPAEAGWAQREIWRILVLLALGALVAEWGAYLYRYGAWPLWKRRGLRG